MTIQIEKEKRKRKKREKNLMWLKFESFVKIKISTELSFCSGFVTKFNT